MRILFAGGGTGGHVTPAIALADEIKRRLPEAHILFVGSRRGVEMSVVPRAGYSIRTLQVIGFRRALSLETFKFPIALAASLVQADRAIRCFRPELVVGTGGYVSGPIGLAAALHGIRLAIQEQNSYPGITTRLLAPMASQVFLTYPESLEYFRNRQRLHVCGNPVRGAIGSTDRDAALEKFGLDRSRLTLLVTGGSQGAHRINEAVLEALPHLSHLESLQILWHTGWRDHEMILKNVRDQRVPIVVRDFIEDMPAAYAAADLLVSRAGANTLAELTVCGLAAILIPLSTAAAHHQEKNARVLADAGAAYVLSERTLTGEGLAEQVTRLLDDPDGLGQMRRASAALGTADAAKRIVDLRRSQITERLASLGIGVEYEHAPQHLAEADVVVYSSAVKLSNPEIVEAKRRKIPVVRRAEMLGELMRMKYGIAVAGTHGKTTTTSMIGEVLSHAGRDPTIIVGGRVRSMETNARLGEGEYLVAEADEFDRSFLRMTPTIAVVTTLEAEHLDCYRDLDEIKDAFVEFINKVPFYGSAVLCLDEETVQSIIPRIEKSLITYGTTPQADVRAEEVTFEGLRTRFEATAEGTSLGSVLLPLPGVHNVKNALAAVTVAVELGIDFDTVRKALESFSGVHRRFEVKGETGGVTVVDDYAHHPTEILATLNGARNACEGRIVAIFQPHLYTRTRAFYRQFGGSFFDSDVLVVTDVYPAREEPIAGVSGELVANAARELGHRNVTYIPDRTQIAGQVIEVLQPGDMVVTLGAGDVWKTGEELLKLLRNTTDSPPGG